MNSELGSAFRGRRVLVTGHTGFKGSWLSIWLHSLGAIVSGYSLPTPTNPSNFTASRVQELLANHVEADIRDRQQILNAVTHIEPEVVFHFAAQPLVRAGYASPAETFDVNVMGTVNLLDAVRRAAHPCIVVVVTSDKCYDNTEHVWGFRECDPMGGSDPYSASKGAAELAVSAYRRTFFGPDKISRHRVKLATVRAGNVIGGGDWALDRIIPDAVKALVCGRPVPVRNPNAIRPWQHVLEPLSGYLLLASRMLRSDDPSLCGAWNFGPATAGARTVRQLVELLISARETGTWQDCSDPVAPVEAASLRLCTDKASAILGWFPRWSTERAISATAEWYAKFYGGAGLELDMRVVCTRDICRYVQTEVQASSD